MKVKILAIALLILTIAAVGINTLLLTKKIEAVSQCVCALPLDAPLHESQAAAKESFENFKREENFLSLTVNHNDLTDIEGLYSEICEDVIRPSAQECFRNPRAKSTKMRWAIRA